jgi:hypothetical protein
MDTYVEPNETWCPIHHETCGMHPSDCSFSCENGEVALRYGRGAIHCNGSVGIRVRQGEMSSLYAEPYLFRSFFLLNLTNVPFLSQLKTSTCSRISRTSRNTQSGYQTPFAVLRSLGAISSKIMFST